MSTRLRRGGDSLRILHLVRQYAPSVGGLQVYVRNLVRQQRLRHEVTVLTLDRTFGAEATSLPREDTIEGVRVVRIPYYGHRRFFWPRLQVAMLNEYDIVHVHAIDGFVDRLALPGAGLRRPFVVTTHGLFFHTEAFRRIKQIYFRLITRSSLSKAAAVFAVSANDRARLEGIGVPNVLVRNPIDPWPYRERPGSDFLYVGRISENKRVEKLIAFYAALPLAARPPRLHVVGHDRENLTPGLQALAAKAGVADGILFHGLLDDAALQAVVDRCRYAISASRYEGFGLAMVESMSAGLLPVMQDNEAFRDLHARSGLGLLVDFDDVQQAVAAFSSWRDADDHDQRRRAHAFALTHGWAEVAQTIEATYRRCLEGARPDAEDLAGGRVPSTIDGRH